MVASDGTAQALNGSPYSGASGWVVATSSYVFATDSKNIVTYTRASDGSLQQTSTIDGTTNNPTPASSAISSLSLDRSGQTVYAGELNFDGADNDAYSFFNIGDGGVLSYLNSSGEDTNYHTPLVFSQGNQHAYGEGCYHMGWEVFGFARNGDGTLTSFDTQAAPPPVNDANTMWCPTDSATSSANYLALAYHDLSVQNGSYYVATYVMNSDGTLSLVANSEVTTPFTGETSMVFDPSGHYLAFAGSAGIQMYQIDANGMLTAVGTVQQPSAAFTMLRWDNSNHLYAISDAGLYIFNANNGTLTEVGSPYPITDPGSLAVLPQS